MKRVLSWLICLSLLLASVTSCSEGRTEETTASSSAGDTAVPESSAEETAGTELFAARIPEGTKYEGTTFALTTSMDDGTIWGDVDWSATEYTGEVLNDAVYSRITQVEDLLDVDIVVEHMGLGDTGPLKTSVTANDNAYQLYTINAGNIVNTASSALIQDLGQFAANGTLDLEAPWWDQNCFEDLSIKNHIYCMTGDIGTMYKKSIAAMMFNKNILEQNQLENPYELMKNGTWTVDKAVELGSKISNDLDGNGTMDGSDQYGLICFRDMLPLAMIGCGIEFFSKDAEDVPVNTFFSERSVAVVEKLATLMYDKNLTYSWTINGVPEQTAFKMYQADQALLYYGELHAVAAMREMESAFGIMPMPKFDEMQENYHHCVNPNVALCYVIPITNIDYERCGYIIDALGAASKNELTPAYYDVTLQGKVSRDEESSASLDVIINSISYDLGYLGNWGLSGMLYEMADARNVDLASKYKRIGKVVDKTLERTVDKLEESFAQGE